MRSHRRSALSSVAALAAVTGALGAAAPAQATVRFSAWPGSPFETQPLSQAPGGAAAGLEVVDIDPDPAPDLAGAFAWTNTIFSAASPALGSRTSVSVGTAYPSGTAAADLDGDGRRDLLVWGGLDKGGGPISVGRGTSSGLVVSTVTQAYPQPLNDAALADFNADGRPDVFASQPTAVSVRTGQPGLTFSDAAGDGAVSVPTTDSDHVAAADVTGDGRADLLASSSAAGGTLTLRTAPSLATAGTVSGVGTALDLFLADVGGDARPEAVVVTGTSVVVYPLSATGAFGTPTTTAVGARSTNRQSAVVDLDGDGDRDVALATTAQDRVVVLESLGDGTFAAPQAALLPGGSRRGPVDAVTSGDFDGDGLPELAVSSNGSYRIDVLRNDADQKPIVRTLPASPVGVETATLSGTVRTRGYAGKAYFQWGETLDYGRATEDVALPAGSTAPVEVKIGIEGLRPETIYRARLVAATTAATTAGDSTIFKTGPAGAPEVTLSLGRTPQVAVSGDPIPFGATAVGSFPPYTYEWNFGDGTTGAGDAPAHAFAPLTQDDAARIKDGSTASDLRPRDSDAAENGFRRGTYTVSVTAKDRFGRPSPTLTRAITIVPNRAPSTAIMPLVTPLDYVSDNPVASGSQDPDTAQDGGDPVDRVIREEWSFDGRSSTTRDPGLPVTKPNCFGSGTLTGCVQPGMPDGAVVVNPWRDDRGGLQPIAALADRTAHPDFDFGPRRSGESWVAYNDRQTVAATALKLFPSQACGAPIETMTGCWPHRTETTVRLRAVDRGGKDVTVEQKVPIRLRARPSADVTLKFPTPEGGSGGTQTGTVADGNEQLPGPIAAQDPANREDTGTVLEFDPRTTLIDDGRDQAVWYAVQIGRPWSKGCNGGVVQPDPITPQLVEQATTIGKPDPIDQLPGGLGIEGVGALTKKYGLARSAAAKAKRAKVVSGGPASQAPAVDVTPVTAPTGACKASFGVDRVIASVVSSDPKALRLTIPEPGKWSALLTVYDRTAGTSRVRLDGISVLASKVECANITGAFGTGPRTFNFTGSCVSGAAAGAGDDKGKFLYWTKNALDVNGIRVAPAPGHYLMIDGRKRAGVYSSTSVPKTVDSAGVDAWKGKDDKVKVSILVEDQPIDRIGLYGLARLSGLTAYDFVPEAGTTYGGLPVARVKSRIDLTLGCSAVGKSGKGSKIDFQVSLPKAFESSGATPTKPIGIPGCNVGNDTVVTKKADTANRNRVKGTFTLSRRAAGKGAKAKRLAEGGAITLDLGPAQVGPVLVKQLQLSYDPASKTFVGKGDGVVLPGIPVTLRVVIVDGELAEVSGSADVPIQLGTTPAKISQFRFKLQLTPKLVIVGGARVTSTDGVTVQADGDITLETAPLKVSLDGTASLLGGAVPLAKVHAEVGDSIVLVNANAGASVGPFTYSLAVGGSFSGEGFNIEGAGRACIFACLGVQGILSSKGAAVCGEIDLWVKTFRPGLGILWKPFDVNAYLDGCGLGPYREDLGQKQQLQPGSAETVPVVEGQTVLSVVAKSGQPGVPPVVTLVPPDGKGTPISSSTAALDGSKFEQKTNSVVDVDRVSGETRFMVAAPAVGTWTVKAEDGSPVVTGVEYARDQALPTKESFAAKVGEVGSGNALDGATYGSLLSTAAKPAAVRKAKTKAFKQAKITGKTKAKAKKSALTAERLRAATPTAALVAASIKQMGPRLSPTTLGPDLSKLRRRVSFNASLGAPGLVTFVERGVDTAQTLASYPVPPDGKVAADFAFLPGLAGDRKRSIDAYVLSESGIPRGVVRDIDTFLAPRPPRSRLATGTKAMLSGKGVAVSLAKVPAYGAKSTAPLVQAVVKAKSGSVTVLSLTGRDFKKSGDRYVAKIRVAGAKSGGTVTLRPIDATGVVAKGGKKISFRP